MTKTLLTGNMMIQEVAKVVGMDADYLRPPFPGASA
jgi:hypothetical protein